MYEKVFGGCDLWGRLWDVGKFKGVIWLEDDHFITGFRKLGLDWFLFLKTVSNCLGYPFLAYKIYFFSSTSLLLIGIKELLDFFGLLSKIKNRKAYFIYCVFLLWKI